MTGRPLARRTRTPIVGRRVRPVRRASAGMSTARAGAALAMLVSAAAVYGVGASPAFDYTRLEVDGVVFTDRAAVEAALAGARGENLFRLATGPLQSQVESLPTVAHASVDIRLPGTLAVTVDERQPVLVWQVGERRWLTDATGTLFAELGDRPPSEAAALPVVVDRRSLSTGLAVGSQLDPLDLDAATRLASLAPDDVGSSAASLAVTVTDETGFVVSTVPEGWTAIFGFYTPSLRTTELIPGQVRLLRSLLDGREPDVGRVVLASATDGTYLPRSTPKPSAKPKNGAKPSTSP
jgi:cell division septal protein FtsQ